MSKNLTLWGVALINPTTYNKSQMSAADDFGRSSRCTGLIPYCALTICLLQDVLKIHHPETNLDYEQVVIVVERH